MTAASLKLHSLAKINIDLRVLHKRPDGYHELRTIFQTISLADTIRVRYEPSAKLSLALTGNVAIEDNLIERAARLVLEETGCTGAFRFQLDKRIPMGAGLGGGSSNAAVILLALPALIQRSIPRERLRRMAVLLGSDVPFFLNGGTAVGLGRGEELYPLPDFPGFSGLLVTPEVHVSTTSAYGSIGPALAVSEERKKAEFSDLAWSEDLSLARNDFEDAVFQMHPELREIRQALDNAGAICARMTGSGSAIFGLFPDSAAAADARSAVPGFTAIPFTLVTRKQYRAIWAKQLAGLREG